jgi:hypothetical protein
MRIQLGIVLRRLQGLGVVSSEKLPPGSCGSDYEELNVKVSFCAQIFGSTGLLCQGYLEEELR